MTSLITYDRAVLLSLYTPAQALGPDIAERVRTLGIRTVCCLRCTHRGYSVRRYRGRRAGRRQRQLPTLRSVGNGAAVIVGNRPTPGPVSVCSRPSALRRVHIARHVTPLETTVRFGCLNIRSLANKVDDLLEIRREQKIDVIFLVETWHDSDSVCFRRLRSEGFQVVDRPRPRSCLDALTTNHGGVAAVAIPGIRLATIDIGVRPTTFEFLCIRVTSGSSSCVVGLVYRPGSEAVTSTLFGEWSDVLDRLSTFVDPIFVVGDVNIHLERPTDPHTSEFNDILSAHGVACRVTGPTHNGGGLLDVVVSRDEMPIPDVAVVDVGLSDHCLLRWSAKLTRPPPVYTPSSVRSWRSLDIADLRAGLQSTLLCRPEMWREFDVDGLARLFDDEVNTVVNQLVPVRTVKCRRRPSDPWFDEDCRAAKRLVR